MCILLYVKVNWCGTITQIYGQMERGGALVYVLSSVCDT